MSLQIKQFFSVGGAAKDILSVHENQSEQDLVEFSLRVALVALTAAAVVATISAFGWAR